MTVKLANLDPQVWQRLQSEAQRRGLPLDAVINEVLLKALAAQPQAQTRPNRSADGLYHDLDHLAGTWTQEEAEEFRKNTECFNQIDPELWS